ncbi:MAG: hypothetical protein GY866_14260 [Proteobacteria bacterium]|nr:hypothetical protein [Pseudomonadota bacterium]
MKLDNRLIIPILILLCISCGRRTPPQPHTIASDQLPAVNGTRLYFRGEDLAIHWQLPGKSKIDEIATFRLNILSPDSECSVCDPTLLDRIHFNAATGKSAPLSIGDGKSNRKPLLSKEADGFLIVIPSGFLQNRDFEDRIIFMIDYVARDGQVSAPSPDLKPVRPIEIPLPEVTVGKLIVDHELSDDSDFQSLFGIRFEEFIGIEEKTSKRALPSSSFQDNKEGAKPRNALLPLQGSKSTDASSLVVVRSGPVFYPSATIGETPKMKYFLLLQWDLRQETIRHIYRRNREIDESIRHYGLNFYRIVEEDGERTEKRINPEPLRAGSFSLANFLDPLYARSVDRYGNESKIVLVFDGHYR